MVTRIIIADDETNQRTYLKGVLTRLGYLVVGEVGDSLSAVQLARYHDFRTLEEKVCTLTKELETSKIIERAKGLLMEKEKLTEREAFQKIQKVSVNNRKSMREVAEAVLLANEM